MGLFVTFEGGEGVGKSTQAGLLADALARAGRSVVRLREPGGTPLGEYLREWLMDGGRALTPEAELLLFTAARAELVRTVLLPAIDAGNDAVLDRYADSTTVYQGYAGSVGMRAVSAANRTATGGLMPRLTVLLDAPPEAALARAQARDAHTETRRFEAAEAAFHRRVRSGFLWLARREPERWLVLDALQDTTTVHAQVWQRVQELLGESR